MINNRQHVDEKVSRRAGRFLDDGFAGGISMAAQHRLQHDAPADQQSTLENRHRLKTSRTAFKGRVR